MDYTAKRRSPNLNELNRFWESQFQQPKNKCEIHDTDEWMLTDWHVMTSMTLLERVMVLWVWVCGGVCRGVCVRALCYVGTPGDLWRSKGHLALCLAELNPTAKLCRKQFSCIRKRDLCQAEVTSPFTLLFRCDV